VADDDPLGFDGDAVHDELKDALLGLEGRVLQGLLDRGAELLEAIKEPELLLALEMELLEFCEAHLEAARVLLDALSAQA
jgi:hypothetical protein